MRASYWPEGQIITLYLCCTRAHAVSSSIHTQMDNLVSKSRETEMVKLAIYAHMEAKPGKEADVEAFLKSALPLVEAEPGTRTWYALSLGHGMYAIVDTFDDDAGRNAHLNGKVAAALLSRASELFAKPPSIAKLEVLAAKVSK